MIEKPIIEVVTAIAPGPAAKKRIEDFVISRSGKSTADITWTLSADIIGGVIIKIGDNIFDGSISRQLKKLK